MISIVIPTLNEEKVIEKTLTRLLSYPGEKEIIVSDGGSTDQTVAIAQKLADMVVVHHGTMRQTIAAGRNAGAAIAHGDYVIFLDADVMIPEPSDFFPSLVEIFNKDARLVACTTALKVLPTLETLTDKIILTIMNWSYFILNNIFQIGAASGEVQCIRSEAFRQIGGFNEAIVVAEDQDMFQRLRRVGKTRFEPSLIAYHTGRRMHIVGWYSLFYQYSINHVSVLVRGRSVSKEWKQIR